MQVRASPSLTATTTPSGASPLRRRDDVAATELVDRYGRQGGLASPDEIVHLMRPYWRQPISILARWIVGRKVVSFSWRARILLPVFQFERPRMAPNQAIADCSLALGDLLDDDGFAGWFVRPCEWLEQRMPVDLLLNEPDAVVDAAGRARFALVARRLAS